jgi:hypothetical protein
MPVNTRNSTDPRPPTPAQPQTAPVQQQPTQPPRPEGYDLPNGPIADGGRVANRAMRELGYVPTWGENPRMVVEAYQVMKATPKDMSLPQWMQGQEQQIEQAYKWHQFRNGNAPPTEWKFLPPDDPGRDYLSAIKGPESSKPIEEKVFSGPEKVQQGQAAWMDISPDERKAILADQNFNITQYPIGVRDQILQDPSFDWSRVPKWQKTYYDIMSNPKLMASPMALAGARAGGIFGLPGKLAGAAAGYGLGLVGGQQYDPTSGVLDQPTIVAGMMAVLNKLSEGAEQTAGYTGQVLDAAIAGTQGNEQAAAAAQKMLFDKDYRRATWEAGRITYEASDFLGARNWLPAIQLLFDITSTSGVNTAAEIKDLMKQTGVQLAGKGEDFIIGQAAPVDRNKATGFNPVTGNFYDVTDSMGILQEARLTIHKAIINGEDPKEVIRQILGEQSQYVGSQVADFAGQMAIDPLEQLPTVTNAAGGALAKVLGNDTAARAFFETDAPMEATRRYQTLVQTGDVAPGFDYSQMGSVSRWAAGINKEGQIKAGPFTQTGLLDRPTKATNIWGKFKEDLAALTPEARAREGAGMFYNNIGALLSTMSDPAEIGKFMRTLSKGDMKVWAEMGNKIAGSPEWYTILPALKDFDQNKVGGLLSAWELAAPKRDALLRVSDVLGDSPGALIEDLAKRGTTEQDFQRIQARLEQANSPEARALLDEIAQGKFTPDHLKDIVDAFSGDGALYWHPDQWKAALMDALGSHFDEWAVEKLQLGKDTPESKAFFRTTHLLKSAQSVLLLGGSPGYALQNGLSNMVHRAATGIYGYMTPGQIDGWLDRFGVKPARLEEGVGIGGVVEQATTKTGVKTDAIQKAVKGNGNDALGKAQRIVSALGKAMPFNKLSSAFESLEGKNGYMIAMRDMWAQTWRRGKGFQEMTPQLRANIERAGINPDTIYGLIEAGMNKAEIEKLIYSRQQGIQARGLVNTAAQRLGIPASSAARLLDKVGVLDELDKGLSKADTPDKVRNAFRAAIQKAHDFQDMQTARDLRAMAEAVTNKVGTEGAPAALDVVQRTNGEYFDAWLDHYSRFGEMFDDLRNIPDPAVRSKAIEENYKISDQEFRRVTARLAANYQGIFEAWGKSGNPRAMEILAAIAQTDAAMKSAYDFMRQTRRQFFDQLNENPNSIPPGKRDADQKSIDEAFDRAFKQKASAEKTMGESLAAIHEELHGKAAGEAARKWWKDYTKFSDEIVKREKAFRQSLIGMNKDQREAAKQRYYGTDKVALIAELEKINQEGIQRLERVIRRGKGGDPTGTPAPTPGTPPRDGGPGSDEVNSLISEAEARVREEEQARKERITSVWDIAEEYAGKELNYRRDNTRDQFALIGALKKEEYGGFPDLKGLSDERLTPEKLRSILDERAKVKTEEQAAKLEKALSTIPAPKITDNTSILTAIKEHGGLQTDLAADLTGDTARRTPGVFSKKGIQMDEMARLLADDGYPINIDDPNDPGGIQQATDLLNRARQGEKVYPIGHDFEAAIKRQEEAYAILQAEEGNVPSRITWEDVIVDTPEADWVREWADNATLPKGREQAVAAAQEFTGRKIIDAGNATDGEASLALAAIVARNADIPQGVPVIFGHALGKNDTWNFRGGGPVSDAVKAAGGIAYVVACDDLVSRNFATAEGKLVRIEDGKLSEVAQVENAPDTWQDDFTKAQTAGDLTRMYELFETLPEEGAAPTGESWIDYASRTVDETAARVEREAIEQTVADGQARYDRDAQAMEARGDAAMTKRILEEKFRDVFDLTDEQAAAYMEISESLAGWYERVTGENGDTFYSRYYEDIVQGGEADLLQSGRIDPINRRMSYDEVTNYARALVRSGADELRRAVVNEPAKADRIAILDAAHKINPDMAVRVAQQASDTLFQGEAYIPKGAVTFDPDGIKATIHAFAAKDVSTLIHENAHVFRRVLSDVATRTDNKKVRADLDTIEEWAGVKDGKWTRDAEEKFARGFERYITEGDAPTPKLRRAFESMKQWMLQVYRQITGTEIDIEITPAVKEVFDRMLSEERQTDILYQKKAKANPGQINMFGAEDLPLFSGTPRTARAETFTPQQATRQETMFDMRPQMKGAETPSIERIMKEVARIPEDDLIPSTEVMNKYFEAHRAGKSSRTTPVEDYPYKPGDWKIDDLQGIYGRNVEKLVEFDPYEIGLSEEDWTQNINYEGRGDDARRYTEWMKEGKQAPAIHVTQMDDGTFKAYDGHRRIAAAKMAGKKIRAWVSYAMDTGKKDFNGKPITASLTYEGAKHGGPEAYRMWEERQDRLLRQIKETKPEPVNPPAAAASAFDNLTDDQITPAERISEGMRAVARKGASIEEIAERADKRFRRKLTPEIIQALAEEAYNGVRDNAGNIITTINPTLGGIMNSIGPNGEIQPQNLAKWEQEQTGRAGTQPPAPDTLFQSANPMGTMENASGFKPDSEWQDAGWKQHVRPLLDAMQETALDKLTNETPLDGAYKDLSPEGQAQLRSYIRQVQNDMGAVKNSTIKWGESQRDHAMLNYNRRYGFDRMLETVAPYQFYYTRSLMTWGMRALDKPAWFANYARIRNAQNQHERDVPERLRNKFRIPAPWLPDWMGDALYIDPLQNLFTPASFLRPFETMMRDKNYQVIEAERVLQEWAADGTADEGQIANAARTQSGALWERALSEAGVRRESEISNPFDFMATMFGPAWYLSTPLNLAGVEVPFLSKGDPNKVTSTPLLNTARAVEATTKGSWAEPIGQLIGLIGRPEEMLRKKAGLPEFGEFGDYYVDRQIANMVAEGSITSQQAQVAMIERQGELFDQARERVKLELAMRTPLAGVILAGTQEGAGAAAKSFLPSLFGSGLLPAGELEYRGLKGEWNAAWKMYDGGDKTAINTFFEEHPEYEAYLAKGKPPEERIKSFMVGNIWDAYMSLGPTNQKAARAQMGEEFARSFLDKETRSYDSLDVQTLTQWAQMLGAMNLPRTAETTPVLDMPAAQQPKLNLYPEQATAITDKFFNDRKEKYPDYFMLQQGFYSLPPSQRSSYLLKFPRLQEYFTWQKGYYEKYPELKPVFQGKAFKTVDTSTWPPALEEYVSIYAMTGAKLPKGAASSLEQIWVREGKPMDDFKTWLNSQVVPAFLYQQGEGQP